MELLLGSMPDVARFVIAFMLVLGLIGAGALLWRKFGAGPLTPMGPRSRQPRLSVIDVAFVDVRRRLILVRRDNTEHLLMIGGPTDIVIEPNIARNGMAPASREPRPIPTGDTVRQPASAEGPEWKLPLEPLARPVRTAEDLDAALLEQPPRTAKEAMAESMRAVRTEPAARRSSSAELRTPLEDEITAPALTPPPLPVESNYRTPAAPEPRRSPPSPPPAQFEPTFPAAPPEARRPPPAPEPVSQSSDAAEPKRIVASSPQQVQSDENNLAEMAQRLEAALRRPTRPVEPPAPPPPPAVRPATARPEPATVRPATARPEPPVMRKTAQFETVNTPKGGVKSPEKGSFKPPEPLPSPPPDLKILSGKAKAEPQAPFESLEDEMAKMLGRSPGKP